MFTSEERESMEIRIAVEVKSLNEGSLIRQEKFDTLIALNNEKEEYFRKKSYKFSKTGDFVHGYPLIEKAVQLDPLTALYFTSWQMLFFYRDYERALSDLQYYDDISPGVNYISGENVNYLKGLALKQMQKYDEAVAEFDICIDQEKSNTSEYVYVYRGIANLRHECLEDAIIDFEKAIENDKNCTMAYVYMGEALLKGGRCDEAMSQLITAEHLLCRGVKKTSPYFEVFDEVQLEQIYDLMEDTGLNMEFF